MEQKPKYLHLITHDTHFYLFADVNKSNSVGLDNVYHKSGLLQRNDNAKPSFSRHKWFWAEEPLAYDGFYTIYHEYTYTHYELTDDLPKHINRDALPVMLPHEYDFDESVFPREYYDEQRVMEEIAEPIDADWYTVEGWHIDDAPTPRIPVDWACDFPYDVTQYQALKHMFPCVIQFVKNYNYMELERELKARFSHRVSGVYVFDNRAAIRFEKARAIEVGPYPVFRGEDLRDTINQFNAWYDALIERIERAIAYDKNGLVVDDMFIGAFDAEFVQQSFKDAKKAVVRAARKSEQAAVQGAMNALYKAVWEQLHAAAAWESGLTPPDEGE